MIYPLSFVPYISIVVTLGFEQTIFTVVEEVGFVELCVNVTDPTDPLREFADINLITQSQDGTAGTYIVTFMAISDKNVFVVK